MRSIIAAGLVLVLAPLALASGSSSGAERQSVAPPSPGSCTPLDLAFVVDDSGSMDPALANVKAGINKIIGDATIIGAGNVRIEVISYETSVNVSVPFTLNNEAAATAGVNALQGTPTNPANLEFPEAGDEALATAVFGLSAGVRAPGQQIGDAAAFRPEAEKIIIFVGDALPAGFDDFFTPGFDDTNAYNIAAAAGAAGIRINSIYTPDLHEDPGEEEYYAQVAAISGGQFVNAGLSGSETAVSINAAVNACGFTPQTCKGKQATKHGTAGNDVMIGTGRADVFSPGGGNDKIIGKGGKDLVCGGAGNDKIKVGGKNDKVFGGGGKDKIGGGGGKDKLNGGGGKDVLRGGPGKDKLRGGPGKDKEIQ